MNILFVKYRGPMLLHLKICEYREFKCEYCDTEVIYNKLVSHYVTCSLFPLTCECKAIIPRDHISAHRNKECPKVFFVFFFFLKLIKLI